MMFAVGCHADPWPPLAPDAGADAGAPDAAVPGIDAAVPGIDAPPVIDAPPAVAALAANDGAGHAVTTLTFDTSDDQTVQIANQGTAPSAAIALAITGDAQQDVAIDPSSTCTGAQLAVGASCTIVLHYHPPDDVLRSGSLTVTPDAGAALAVAVQPVFQPALHVAFAGGAPGEVRVDDDFGNFLTVCTAPCRVRAMMGQTLYVTATTPSEFGGLSGACTTTAGSAACAATLGPTTTTLTATFTARSGELFTRLLGTARVMSAAFDSGDNLVVASNVITKLSPTGATLWQVPLAVCMVAIGPGDTIYAQTATELHKLDAAGAPVWTRPLDPRAIGCGNDSGNDTEFDGFLHNLAVGSDGAVAVHGTAGVARWDSDGNLSWSAALVHASRFGVSIDPQGNVGAAIESENGETTDLARFAPDGTALALQEGIAVQSHGMHVIDASGRLLATSSGHSHTDALGHSVQIPDPDFAPNGICAAGSGAVWLYEPDDSSIFARTWIVNRYGADGGLVSTYTNPSFASRDQDAFGTDPHDLACTAGRIAVVGAFSGVVTPSGWVTVLQP